MVSSIKANMSAGGRRFFSNNNRNSQQQKPWNQGQNRSIDMPNNMQGPLLPYPFNRFLPNLLMPQNRHQNLPRNHPLNISRNPIPFSGRNPRFGNPAPPNINSPNNSRKRPHSSSSSGGGASTSQDDSYGKRHKDTISSPSVQDKDSIEKYSELTEQANSLVVNQSQSQDLLEKKLRLRSALLCMIKKKLPGISLHLVGSSCNGFASQTSDADFCVMVSQVRKINQQFEARTYLKQIEKLIRPIRSLKGIQFIRAKVPILKFKDEISGCECDINVNNPVGIRNTHLLRTYSKIDDRVRPMVLAIKTWAKARDINDASQGTLSSYSLVLMIVHYLQFACQPPVLKSLQKEYPQYFQPDSDVDELPMFEPADEIPCNTSRNKESIGQLMEGFFRYFAEVFNWESKIMSIREGCTLPKNNNAEFRDRYIGIEEPFELTCTSRAVHEISKFVAIKKEFRRANERLKEQLSMDYIT